MSKKLSFVFIICSYIFIFAQNDYILKKIHFKGNETLSSSSLTKKLSLQARNFSHTLLFWKDEPIFYENYLEEDRKQIQVQYQKVGFLNAEVKAKTKKNHKKKEVEVFFEIKENQPVIVEDIRFKILPEREIDKTSLEKLLDLHSLEFKVKKDERFIDSNIQAVPKQINSLLKEYGFPDPSTDFHVILTQENSKAIVEYIINAGHYCDFGKIRVTGNAKTKDKIILKQVSFLKDEIFTQAETQKTQQQIQNLGLFQFVTVKTLLNEIDANKIPIEILVKELPFWSFKTGIGYGLEDRFRVSVNIKKLSFFGGARRAVIFAKHSYLEPYHFSLKMTQPTFLNPKGNLSLKPFIKKEHESAYDLQRYGVTTTFQQNISLFTNSFITYKFERDNLELDENMSVDAEELKNEYYNKSSVSLGISFDNSNPPFFPENGLSLSLVTTLSGLKLRSKYHYLQGLVDLRKYQRVVSGTVIAGRVKIGSMKPIWNDTETPIEERFYAGGSTSIRGWKRGKVGPENEDDLPIGGESYLEFSAELRQHIWKIFYLVTFLDAGNVWAKYDQHDGNDLFYSAGAGIRIKTPIGPIRFDAAQPLWSVQKRILLHLSIGQAF